MLAADALSGFLADLLLLLFVPFSVESYDRLGVPAMNLLHDLGDEAASPGNHVTGVRWG
jgi:putative effector of murein hydrolase LrgA (UPF0299 family)